MMKSVHILVQNTLKAVHSNVLRVFPEKPTTLPLITFAEITNVHQSKWRDEVTFQVDVYAPTFAEMYDLALECDEAMQGIGFYRTYASPDTSARQEENLFKKAMSYEAIIDTYHNNIVMEG